jgi:hypothetical protein
MKYIHLNEADSEARLREARKKIESERQEDKGGHTCEENQGSETIEVPKLSDSGDFWRARRGSNSRPDDSKSSALSN